MPKLQPITGLAACGTAGGRISYGSRSGEQFVLCDGGCSFWLNVDEIAYLGPTSGSWAGVPGATIPQAVNIHTGARRPLEVRADGQAPRQAHFLAAAADRWQAAIAGQGWSFGSCGEFPGGTVSRAMTDGRGAAGVDGTIALVDLYQGENHGFRLGRPSGSTFPPIGTPAIADGTDPYHLTVLDQNRAIWPTRFSWGTFGLEAPRWIPGSLRACYLEIAGVAYLVHYLEGRGLVARRADSTRGKVLANAGREYHYDAIAFNGGIRAAWATFDGEPPGSLVIVDWDLVSDLEELGPPPDPPVVIPTFRFSHPVIVAPFKDPQGTSGATHEITVNGAGMTIERPHFAAGDSLNDRRGELLGIYSESTDNPIADLGLAAGMKTRLLLCRDRAGAWRIPSTLRAWDIPARELYLTVGETVDEAAARWGREVRDALEQWPGDLAVVPMFYCQGGAPPNEIWPVWAVCQGLAHLDPIVNLSPRIKVIAPFSYLRANGIVAHPELRQAFENLKTAAHEAGVATLTPIPRPPDPKPPTFRTHTKGLTMEIDGKIVRLRGAGGRVIAPDAPNTGTWGSLGKGWRGTRDVDENDPAGRMRARKVDGNRYTFTSEATHGIAGADGTRHSGSLATQTYFKPDGDTDAGDYERWRVYDGNENGALEAQIEHVTDNEHADGPGRKFFAFPLSVEIVS